MSTKLLCFTIFRATFFRCFCPNGPICPCQCGCGCFDETSGRIAQTGMIILFLFNISLFQYTVPIFYSVFFSCHDTTTTIFDVLFLTYYLLLLYSNLLNLLNVALKMNYRDPKFATTKILTTAILNKLTRCPIQFAIFKKFLSFLYLCLKCFIDVWYSKNKFIYHKICRTPCICFILIVGMTPPNQIYAHKRSLLEKCSICIF